MENEETVDQELEAEEADGYYGEDDMDDEELDLSFLDEEEDDDEAADDKPAK